MRLARHAILVAIALVCGVVSGTPVRAAEAPSAKLALSFRPTQKHVEIENPEPAEMAKCKVQVERSGKLSGWVVLGPQGQVLRRFVDTNSDNVVDQWRYYHHGLEVYRDVDSNFNNKVDQHRWVNTGGSRWAVDENEDGHVDRWKVLSAEEATREAVRALVTRDQKLLQTLLITSEDARQLKLESKLAAKLDDAVSNPGKKLNDVLSKSRTITSATQWMRFDGSSPGVIPADAGKASADLTVYENVMAIVETGGQSGLVQIGEMVRVDDVWKLTQIPQPLEGNSVQVTLGGVLMQPSLAGATAEAASSISPEAQELLDELRELDQNSPSPSAGRTVLARYNAERADLLTKLVNASESDEARQQWLKQMVDGLAAAVQTGSYPEGLTRLKSIESEVRRAKSPMLAYVSYRRLLADYSTRVNGAEANEERQAVQTWWLKELERFAESYPSAEDTSEALLQLAVAEEFAGKMSEARKWYNRLVSSHGKTTAGQRAAGALKRLDLEGKTFSFSAPGLSGGTVEASRYRGKVLLVLFWSTWCKPCTEDLPQLKALYNKYRPEGFEVVGVNLDATTDPVGAYLRQHQVPWQHAHEPGGLESRPAREFGIISLPTMFLVDQRGKVISRATSVADLKQRLPELLK